MNIENSVTLAVVIVSLGGLVALTRACEASYKDDANFRECIEKCVRIPNPPIECRAGCRQAGNP